METYIEHQHKCSGMVLVISTLIKSGREVYLFIRNNKSSFEFKGIDSLQVEQDPGLIPRVGHNGHTERGGESVCE